MSTENYVLNAELRDDQGKGASRRLRRTGKFPAIVYGAGKEPVAITLDHNEILRYMEDEAFYSSLLSLKLGGEDERVILRDIQRHPAKPFVLHVDLLRVKKGELLRMHVPLHFMGEEDSPGVKAGGVSMHNMVEVEIECLPRNLPEYIEVDVSKLDVGDAVHLSELQMPDDVTLVAMMGADEMSEEEMHAIDQPVASIQHKLVEEVEPEPEEVAAEEEAGEAGAAEEPAKEEGGEE
ncbi:MAG TPA: 50S ribosomal protein L25/general stress protein Ctc [Chromatiales bacterium]|nr:50S ribosomal protein L25/general stress protein Ctc [Thiotrichales bacterium]HIP69151.1 50S ribosomal protein L25/general stress protein Ctc [Chromatiales bacterium]